MVSKHIYVQGQKIVINCDDFLDSYADWLFRIIDGIFKNDSIPKDGDRFDCGWCFFTLRKNKLDDLVVVAPDMTTDPFLNEVDDLSDVFFIHGEQTEFALSEGTEPVFTSFKDKIVCEKGCFEKPDLFMTRTEATTYSGDSGWYIGIKDSSKKNKPPVSTDLEAVYAFELTKLRPALLRVLTLPPGYVITFKNDAIEFVGK